MWIESGSSADRPLEKLACVRLSIKNDPLYVHAQWVASFSDSANSSLEALLSLTEHA